MRRSGVRDPKPARPPDPCTTRLPDPPTAKLEMHHRLKMIFLVDLFFVPWKMALFPYGFDAKPEGPPDPCPTRLPDPPTAKLEVHHRLKMIFG